MAAFEKKNKTKIRRSKTFRLTHTLVAVHSHEHPIDLNCVSAINLNLEDESDKEQTVRRRLLVELT